MKYALVLAAAAVGLVAAQPHANHMRLHKKDAQVTVTDWTVVTVTDVVTINGPSPPAKPTEPAKSEPAAPPAQSDAPKPQQPSPAPAPAPVAPSPAPVAPSPAPVAPSEPAAPPPAAPSSKAAPAPSQPSAAPPSGPAPAPGVGTYGTQPGASVPADCTKDKPCTDAGMTTYTPGQGACGFTDSPDDITVVALQMNMFGSKTNQGPGINMNDLCNKKIQITNPKNGATAQGVIRDRCQGCTGSAGLDLNLPLFKQLNDGQDTGRFPVEWYFVS